MEYCNARKLSPGEVANMTQGTGYHTKSDVFFKSTGEIFSVILLVILLVLLYCCLRWLYNCYRRCCCCCESDEDKVSDEDVTPSADYEARITSELAAITARLDQNASRIHHEARTDHHVGAAIEIAAPTAVGERWNYCDPGEPPRGAGVCTGARGAQPRGLLALLGNRPPGCAPR